MENLTIRRKAKELGVHLWQIAERVGLTDSNFSRKLRRELPSEERDKILQMIDEIASEREGG